MTVNDLMNLLIVASDAKPDEEKGEVCWRASDYMWRNRERFPEFTKYEVWKYYASLDECHEPARRRSPTKDYLGCRKAGT